MERKAQIIQPIDLILSVSIRASQLRMEWFHNFNLKHCTTQEHLGLSQWVSCFTATIGHSEPIHCPIFKLLEAAWQQRGIMYVYIFYSVTDPESEPAGPSGDVGQTVEHGQHLGPVMGQHDLTQLLQKLGQQPARPRGILVPARILLCRPRRLWNSTHVQKT
jgi:hypothetical protein